LAPKKLLLRHKEEMIFKGLIQIVSYKENINLDYENNFVVFLDVYSLQM